MRKTTCFYRCTLNAITLHRKRQNLNPVSCECIQILKNSRQIRTWNCHLISFPFLLEDLVCNSYGFVKHFVTAQYTVNVERIGNWVPSDHNLCGVCLIQCSNVDGGLTRSCRNKETIKRTWSKYGYLKELSYGFWVILAGYKITLNWKETWKY